MYLALLFAKNPWSCASVGSAMTMRFVKSGTMYSMTRAS
jgi:hypothetical protein